MNHAQQTDTSDHIPVPATQTTEAKRFAKFMTVGGIGFLIDAGTLYLFTRGAGLTLLVAQAISFSIAVVNNFVWNRHWTFPEARGKAFHHQLMQFYVTSAAGLVVRSVTIGLLESPFERFALAHHLLAVHPKLISDYAALSVAIVIVSVWNYVINRIWTFREVH